jgi:hypothetical protein
MGDGTASRERSAVQKSANALHRPSWDLISASLGTARQKTNSKAGGLPGLTNPDFASKPAFSWHC